MLFSAQLPLQNLIELCRALRHNLGAGLSLVDVFRQQATRGSPALRPIAARISDGLVQGHDLERELERERAAFPPLFLSLASVGEHTGNLPEIFHELEKYYRLQQKLRRQFMMQSIRPILQFFAAIFVISGMIFILGLLTTPGSPPFDPLGFGLTGESGALLFLLFAFGSVGALIGLYFAVTRLMRQKAAVDSIVLRIPVLGSCLHSLAMTRFCVALRLTLETGMPIAQALRLSLRATGNAAFAALSPQVEAALHGGEDLTEALTATRIFGVEFQNIMAVAEESGRITEVMEQQATYYHEESERRLTILTQMASWGTWLAVAVLIIFVIFRIALTYISLLDPDNPMYK